MTDATRYSDMIKAALDYCPDPDVTFEGVMAMLRESRGLAWYSPNAVMITEPGPRNLLHMSICGGELDELLTILLPAVEKYARDNGCKGLTGFGRAGWPRILRKHGFESRAIYFEKDFA